MNAPNSGKKGTAVTNIDRMNASRLKNDCRFLIKSPYHKHTPTEQQKSCHEFKKIKNKNEY